MIQLFNAGGGMITVDEFGFEHYLEEGWGFTPPERFNKDRVASSVRKVEEPSITKVEVADSKVTVSDESPKKTSETSKLGKTATKTAAR